MIRSDQENATQFFHSREKPAELFVAVLDSDNGGREVACVAHHVWVCVVDPAYIKAFRLERFDACVGDLCRLRRECSGI